LASNFNAVGVMQKNARATEQDRGAAHLNTVQMDTVHASDSPVLDQASLARRLLHGEHAAAEELVDAYYSRIYVLMRAMGYDGHTSEDLTQETFMRAWTHIGQLRDGKALAGWVFRIAGNVARLHWRRQKHLEAVPDATEMLPDGSEQAGWREEYAVLRNAVSNLPWKLRQAVVLHYMNQLSIAEAADAAGIRQGTLKSRLNRALEVLREQFPDR
jgi:RNA polymerase sigma-70 factor, ECF subfamily